MNGYVDQFGRAMVQVEIFSEKDDSFRKLEAWVDTAFTGELMLPERVIEELGLKPSGSVDGLLANGSQIIVPLYQCKLNWFEKERDLDILSSINTLPLLGIGLLLAKKLIVDYTNLTIEIVPSARLS